MRVNASILSTIKVRNGRYFVGKWKQIPLQQNRWKVQKTLKYLLLWDMLSKKSPVLSRMHEHSHRPIPSGFTQSACARVHGATKSNLHPPFDAMFDTLQKQCRLEMLIKYVVVNKSLTKAVVSDSCKKDIEGFITLQIILKEALQLFTRQVF